MHSTTPTRVSILPVLDYGPPAGGNPPAGNVGAPFDALLHPPPPVCPPPPKEDQAADDRSDRHPRRAPRGEAAATEQSHARGHVEPTDAPQASEQPQATTAEVAEDSVEAAGGETASTEDTETSQAVESLAALAGIVPPAAPGDSSAVSTGEDSATTAIDPAGEAGIPDSALSAPQQRPLAAPKEAAQAAAPEQPIAAAVDGQTDVSADTQPTEIPSTAVETAEIDESKSPQSAAGVDDKPTESSGSEQRESFALDGADDSATKQPADSVSTPATSSLTNENAATRPSETTAPPVVAPEQVTAPADSARPMHAPGLYADAANSVPRSRLPAAVLAPEPAAGQPSVQIDSVRLLQRVARAFHAAQQRDGEIQLRLSPAELGSLRLQVSVIEGALTARVEAESPAARAALVENLPLLRERLHEQGVRIERFEVDLMQRHNEGHGMPDRPHDHDRNLPQLPAAASRRRPVTEHQPAGTAAPRALGPGKLNVIV